MQCHRCASVCPSHAGIVSKWLNLGSRKELHTIDLGLIIWQWRNSNGITNNRGAKCRWSRI